MSKQWWSSRAGFMVQGACLLVLFTWSVARRTPAGTGRTPAEPAAVIDNSEDNAVADNTADGGEADARFVAPPTVRFRTEHPPAGSLNPRPVEVSEPESEREHAAPWQPVHPQNPPRRVPGGGKDGLRSPFEISGNGATVYNAPPPDAD